MPWRNCSECGRSYNDTKGGCTNRACKKFDQNAVKATVAQTSTVRSVAPPKMLPSSLVASPIPRIDNPVQSDPVILSWVATQGAKQSGLPPPKGAELNAEPFTLICYRGEKSEWWPEPRMRLACGGMHVFEPWPGKSISDIWKKLVEEVRKEAGFTVNQKVAAYAQYLRASGRPFALATARTTSGSFTVDYNYVIEIENARTFRWRKDYTLGQAANFKDMSKTKYTRIVNQNAEVWEKDNIDADYIVLNADTIAASTILGFGHKTGTYEVTFLHDLPLSCVKLVNSQKPAPFTREQLEKMPESDKKQTALKLFRKS
jgi:hypothetical protein